MILSDCVIKIPFFDSDIESSAISPPVIVPEASIALVTTLKLPVVIIVPVSSGIVNVLSAVGLVAVKIVSKSSTLDPSNTIED